MVRRPGSDPGLETAGLRTRGYASQYSFTDPALLGDEVGARGLASAKETYGYARAPFLIY